MNRRGTIQKELINKLYQDNYLNKDELLYLLSNMKKDDQDYLIHYAHKTKMKVYGDKVYVRGLIEFTNYCKKSCSYCGINGLNKNVERYRLDLNDILLCCEQGYKLGFRTFVLQGGEDNYYTDNMIEEIVREIKIRYEDAAITLSIGERSYQSYLRYYNAGVDRYLLRHETANKELFNKIHPNSDFHRRMDCLSYLKDIGYQVGAGFMVGIPTQTKEDLVEDILFLHKIDPEMVGIGPFIPHGDTIYHNEIAGSMEDTITMLALVRLFLPYVLLPASTALASINNRGRELGLLAGANVVMPNLSPRNVRAKYSLYEGKAYTGNEAAESLANLNDEIRKAGFSMDLSRGDNIKWGKIL